MRKGNVLSTCAVLLIAVLAVLAIGCSSKNPVSDNPVENAHSDQETNINELFSIETVGGVMLASEMEINATITAIDLENGTITIDTHAETINFDNETFIYSKLTPASVNNTGFAKGTTGDNNENTDGRFKIKISSFDLEIGDKVAVYANSVDEMNLYAVAIELDEASFTSQGSFELKDFIGNIDLETGTVQFLLNTQLVGYIDESTILLGYEGEPIGLDMFFVCELVEISGTLIGENEIQISSMAKSTDWSW